MATAQLNEDAQEQLSRIQSIISCYSGDLSQRHIEGLFVAASALSAAQPNVLLAQGILWDLEFENIQTKGGFPSRVLANLTGGWPMVTVGMGMVAATIVFLIFWGIFVGLWEVKALPVVLTYGSSNLVTSMFFGMLGASMSILTRIKRPVDLQKLNPISLFLNCLFKPMVGATFGALLYFMLESNLFGGILMDSVANNDVKHIFLLSVVGFIAGFSERFAADAIAGAEATIPDPRAVQGSRARTPATPA